MRRVMNALRFWVNRAAAWLRHRTWKPRNRLLDLLVPAFALVALTGLAVLERYRSWRRRVRGDRPRIVWGPSGLLNYKYWSDAMRRRGFESTTLVDVPTSVGDRDDFDLVRDDFIGDGTLDERLWNYRMFAWALRNGDVFVRFMDLGNLRFTPLQWLEYPLTRLAGKKLIVTSYGGDIAVAGHLGRFEEVTFADYPNLKGQAELFTKRIHHSIRWANLTIRNIGLGYVPSFDAIALSQLTIDTAQWSDSNPGSERNGRDGSVAVVHAPNHRRIKGTHHLEEAVEALREEGLQIDLQVLEGRSNEEVHAIVLGTDIVADQFYGGYGLFAIEGMAAGKPVLGNLTMEWLPDEVLAAKAEQGCPIVDSGPERLREDLRRLVESPGLRAKLGREGREFVMANHSYEATGKAWEHFFDHVCTGMPLPKHLRAERGVSWSREGPDSPAEDSRMR